MDAGGGIFNHTGTTTIKNSIRNGQPV
jgi:hypothetical protein